MEKEQQQQQAAASEHHHGSQNNGSPQEKGHFVGVNSRCDHAYCPHSGSLPGQRPRPREVSPVELRIKTPGPSSPPLYLS